MFSDLDDIMECAQHTHSSSEIVDNAHAHVCVVCGDSASGYRFYGASSVCFSCRIFFRRAATSDRKFTCTSIERENENNCIIEKVNRSQCKKCRYDKCLSVGLLPYLVNTPNRKARGIKKPEKQKLVAYPVNQLEEIKSNLKIKMNPTKQYQLELDDPLFKQNSFQILMQSISEVFFSSYLEQFMEIDGAIISQARGNRPVITIKPKAIDVGYNFLVTVMYMANKTFFPSFSNEELQSLSKSATRTMLGFSHCILDYFPAANLLEQRQKCTRIFPDKVLSLYKERFPDVESLDPVPFENFDIGITPYAKSYDDEKFIENTIDKFKQILCHDEELCELFLLLAIFSPVNVDLCVEGLRLVSHYQQKVSIMIYSHFMSRRNYDNVMSLDTMARIAACIGDLNRIGFILQHGLLKNDENEEIIDVDSIEVEAFEEDSTCLLLH